MKKNKKDILNKMRSGDTGFSIPENYFDQFEKDLYENKGKVKSGFTTPEQAGIYCCFCSGFGASKN